MDELTTRDRLLFIREVLTLGRRLSDLAEERFRAVGLTYARGRLLYWLSETPEGMSQTALAERASVEPATLVRAIDALEKQGLVERRPSPADRRVNLVFITDAARPLLKQAFDMGEEMRRELMCDVTAAELLAATTLMRKVHKRLDAAVGGGFAHALGVP